MTSQSQDPIFTIEQAAAYLAVRKSWLYDNYRPLAIPYYKLGGRSIRFRRSALDGWLEGCATAA